jgi:TonB family protein
MIPQRKKNNSAKINLIISVVFHSVLVAVVFYFAAKEGLLGKKLKELTVTMVKEKKPEPPKEKPPEPKIEPPKTQEAKVSVPQPKTETVTAPPPPAATAEAPEAAPAPVALPSFAFSDGAIDVQSISDPNSVYKALVEHTLRSYWNRPEDMTDDSFVAVVELTIDKTGYVDDWRWLNGSGNTRWDQTVKDAVTQLKAISRPPPKDFPGKFSVRFDVESVATEGIELGSR